MANIEQMSGSMYEHANNSSANMSANMSAPPNMSGANLSANNMRPNNMSGNNMSSGNSSMMQPVPFDCSDIDSDDISVDDHSDEGGDSDIEKTYTNLDGSRKEMLNSTMIQQAFAQSIGLGLVQQAARQSAEMPPGMSTCLPFQSLQMPPPPKARHGHGHGHGQGQEHANQPAGWTHHLRATPTPPFNAPDPGPAKILPPDAPELAYFNLLFPESLIEQLMVETNRYAEHTRADKANANWKPLTLTEIKSYLGIRIYMSILSLPHQDMYWSTDWLFGNLACSQIMAKNRFQNIARNFNANDMTTNPPVTAPDHDKLHAIRPILNTVIRMCKEQYHPHQNMCIDETIITYKGKLGWRQRSADGTTVGIKVWMRADSTNGYVNDFQFYTGKSQEGKMEGGLAARVALDLTKDLHNTNAIVNMKGFFTSPYLFDKFYDLGIRCRGTVKPERKDFPEAQLGSKSFTQHGQSAVVQKGNISAYAWKDKRVVHVMSTADDATVTDNVTRKQRDGWIKPVPCPMAISNCNKYSHGVSHANQLRLEYPSSRTSNKWWHYLFWFIFDTCIANSYIIMKETHIRRQAGSSSGTRKMCTLEFKKNLAKQLVAGQMMTSKKRKSPERPTSNAPLKVKFKRVKTKKSEKKSPRRQRASKPEDIEMQVVLPTVDDVYASDAVEEYEKEDADVSKDDDDEDAADDATDEPVASQSPSTTSD